MLETKNSAPEYDQFQYSDYAEQPFSSLEEAILKAARLRDADPHRFYRVVPTDPDLTAFRVESVSKVKVYADFLGRITDRWASLISRLQRL